MNYIALALAIVSAFGLYEWRSAEKNVARLEAEVEGFKDAAREARKLTEVSNAGTAQRTANCAAARGADDSAGRLRDAIAAYNETARSAAAQREASTATDVVPADMLRRLEEHGRRVAATADDWYASGAECAGRAEVMEHQ